MGGAAIHHPGWVGDPLNTPPNPRNYAKRTHAPAGTPGALPDIMNRREIKAWMKRNVKNFVDECGEVDYTSMVEAWDRECSDGAATLDPDHVAWEVATEVTP